jgi:hypothetical protein
MLEGTKGDMQREHNTPQRENDIGEDNGSR